MMHDKKRTAIYAGLFAAAALLLLLLFCGLPGPELFPAAVEGGSCTLFSGENPPAVQISSEALREFKDYLGAPRRRFFHRTKDQVFLHLKIVDEKDRLCDLLFLNTKDEPCVVRSGDRYYTVLRSSDEVKAFTEKLARAVSE
ncbi:MAG: hypothetical protein IJT50_09560 [Lentisphaeria bacterium]|nr:hypothetical protein [Lentisphaeria bacterium]